MPATNPRPPFSAATSQRTIAAHLRASLCTVTPVADGADLLAPVSAPARPAATLDVMLAGSDRPRAHEPSLSPRCLMGVCEHVARVA
jgi:hypothetical protein